MVFSQQTKESKLNKERAREKKRSRVKNDRSDGNGRSKNQDKFSKQGYSNAPNYKDDRFIPLYLKGKLVSPYGPHVLGMVRGMRINVRTIGIVAMGVEIVAT